MKILFNSSLLNKVSIFPKRKLTFTYFEIECFRGLSVGYQRQSTYMCHEEIFFQKTKKKKFLPLFRFSRGRARTQLQLIPRALQKTASTAPASSSDNSTVSSEEKTEAKPGAEVNQGFSNEYFRSLLQKKN